jgi:hypothetical protein
VSPWAEAVPLPRLLLPVPQAVLKAEAAKAKVRRCRLTPCWPQVHAGMIPGWHCLISALEADLPQPPQPASI